MGRTLPPGLSPWRAVGLAAAAGGVVTLASLLPLDSVAYHSDALHVAIETAAALIALLCAALLFGRFLREPSVCELVLAGSLLMLGLTNLCFAVVPWVIDEQPGSFDTWAPVVGRLLGAAGLDFGAWSRAGRVEDPRRSAWHAVIAVGAALLLIGLASAALAPHLPVGIDADLPPNPSGPKLVGAPGLLVCQVVGALLYTFAAFGFASRAERADDELMTWFGASRYVAAFGR